MPGGGRGDKRAWNLRSHNKRRYQEVLTSTDFPEYHLCQRQRFHEGPISISRGAAPVYENAF